MVARRSSPHPLACWSAVLGLLAAGCGGAPADDATGWQVERTETDGVTTVRNIAGSRWGRDATLVEEVSIGVLEGDDAYMLAQPIALWLTDSEIYVVDSQDHRVRVYDLSGRFARQFGRQGQGPGELEWPLAIAVVDRQVLVASGKGRVSVFTEDGEHVADWNLGFNPAFQFFVTGDGIYTRRYAKPESPADILTMPQAFQAIGPGGFAGTPQAIPDLGSPTLIELEVGGYRMPIPVPMTPSDEVWSISPDGMLVVGFADRYRFEIRELDGTLRTIVERRGQEVSVQPEEAEEARLLLAASLAPKAGAVDWTGAGLPTTKPAYAMIKAHRDGRIWIYRQGPGTRRADCVTAARPSLGESPPACWQSTMLVEVFGMDGSYLGAVRSSNGDPIVPLDVHGDRAAILVESEEGAPLVKIYRLVIPNEESGD